MSIRRVSRFLSPGVIGAVSFLVLGCPPSAARKPQFSTPITTTEADQELDTGHISVHAAVAREVPFGEERLTFGQLTDAARIFALLQGSNQAARLKSTYTAFSAGASASAPLLQALTVSDTSNREAATSALTSDGSETADGKASASSKSSTSSDDSLSLGGEREAVYKKPEFSPAPAGVLSLPTGSSTTSATPYELFYATAETLLAARSLEHLYNVADAPDGYTLFSIPLVATFEPGRITRTNYTGECVLVFGPGEASKTAGGGAVNEASATGMPAVSVAPTATPVPTATPTETGTSTTQSTEGMTSGAVASIKLLAVAPAGLSSFASSSLSELSRMQVSLGAGVPLGAAALQLQAGAVREAMDAFSSMARRPDLQVSIADDRTLVIRYLGRETFEGGVALSPASFNMEVLALIRFEEVKAATTSSSDPRAILQIAAEGERRMPRSVAREISLVKTGRFKPAFGSRAPACSRPAKEAKVEEANAVPTYPAVTPTPSPSSITVYVPAKPTRIDSAVYYPDGRILLSGDFRESSCTCLEVFVGAGGSKADLIPRCRLAAQKAASLTFDGLKVEDLGAGQEGNLFGRVSYFEKRDAGGCTSQTVAEGALTVPDRVVTLSIKLASPPPKSPTPPGSAAIKSVSGTLDDLGATLFLEYTGDASDPLVLVDGQTAPRTRLEVTSKKGEKADIVTGGRVWLRIPGRHDAKLIEKTYILSVGSGTETKETRLVVAKR